MEVAGAHERFICATERGYGDRRPARNVRRKGGSVLLELLLEHFHWRRQH